MSVESDAFNTMFLPLAGETGTSTGYTVGLFSFLELFDLANQIHR